MKRTFQYRLYPNRDQSARLERTLHLCCELYNAALEERRTAWRTHRQSVSVAAQMAELPGLKQDRTDLAGVYSQVLQDVLWRADRSFQNFFRRVRQGAEQVGYPRFKSRDRYDSFTYPQSGFSFNQDRLCLSKIGNLKVKWHRPMEGQIKTCTIRRDVDQWFVSFVCELPDPQGVLPLTQVGIDVGIESFAVRSDGESVENPRLLERALHKLRRAQRSLARTKRGSHRRVKARRCVARQHRTVRRQRLDFHHQTAHALVDEFDLVVIEDLNVAGMVRNHTLARHIADVGWAQFARILSSKAAEAGKTVIRVDARYTSQVCSGCGAVVEKDLSVRWHACPQCGLSIHRDHNAARNILLKGTAAWAGRSDANRVSGHGGPRSPRL